MLYLAYEAAIGDAEEHEARVVAHDAHLVDYRGVAHHSHHIGVFAQKGCGGGVERRTHIGYINIHEGGAVDTSGKIYHRHIAGVPSALAATRCHQCSQSYPVAAIANLFILLDICDKDRDPCRCLDKASQPIPVDYRLL